MSFSTVDGPEYEKFYDQASISEGNSVDSFILGRRPSDQRDKKKGKRKKDSVGDDNFLSSFMRPFSHCCAPFRRQPAPEDTNLLNVGGGSAYYEGPGVLGGFAEGVVGATVGVGGSEDSDDSNSSGGGTYAYIPRGAKIQALAVGEEGSRRASYATKGHADVSEEEIYSWKVELPLSYFDEKDYLTVSQKQMAVVFWCLHNEQSSRMSQKLLKLLDKQARDSPEEVKVEVELKKADFAVLELVRHIEARMIEEVLGDLYKSAQELQGSGGMYVILSRDKASVGIYARPQGEALFLSVYDPDIVKRQRGPAFFGFTQIDNVGKFVSKLFESSKPSSGSANRYIVYLLKSKHAYLPSEQEQRKDWEKKGVAEKQDIWTGGGKKKLDKQHEAKVVYSAMYAATGPKAQGEQVFSYTPQAGMHVQSDSEVKREAAFHKDA